MARVEDSMKKEHATLTPASKSLLEFRVDAHHIVVEDNGTFSVGQVLVCWVGPGLSTPFWLKPWPHHVVFPPTHSNIWRRSVARVEDSMKKEHATLTPASKSLLEFRVDAHHIVVFDINFLFDKI